MRRFIKTFALMAVAVVGAVSCTKDIARDNMSSAAEGVTLYASTPNENVSSKVGFVDNGTDGIAMSWESGDTFALYQGETKIDDFKTGNGDGKFTSVNSATKLTDGVEYTAKYKEGANLAEQNGDEINNLNAACQMEATFTYGDDNRVKFAHTKAIMTFTFKSEARPAYLVFENGEESYKVTYTNLSPDGGIYTSHIMINPCDATTRTLTFSLYATNDATVPYDVRSVESSIAYKKGYRYTAPISDLPYLWSDFAAESFAVDGNISSAAELALLAKNVNGGETYSGTTFTLTQDIDLSGHEWVAIGGTNYFKGTFDGAGHKITGLYINQPKKNNQALFGSIYEATIKDLSVSGEVTGDDYVGGIVGGDNSSTITNCYNSCSVVGSSDGYVGGIAGYAYFATIANCYNSGSVVGSSKAYVGGVIGGVGGATNITNCCNSGSVESSSNAYLGGIAGYNSSTITNCYNKGVVRGGDEAYVGGVVGYANNKNITNCYNSNSVEGGSNAYVGGVVGRAYNNNKTITINITNCYNSSSMVGSSSAKVGGVVGYNYSNCTVTNCYWNNTVNDSERHGIGEDSSTDSSVEGKSTAEMQSEDFKNTLNNNAYKYNNTDPVPAIAACAWGWTSGYPTLDFDGVPIKTKFSGGDGTASAPYKISCRADFDELSADVNGGTNYTGNYFVMTKDVELGGESNEFTAIGSKEDFSGTFDGAGHAITGLYINDNGLNLGLFGYTEDATIKNLSVSGSVTSTYSGSQGNVGGVVGWADNTTITNCYNSCSLSLVGGNENYIGGVAGVADSGTSITNSYNSGSLVGGNKNYIGGVAGYVSYSTITNCYNSGSHDGGDEVGGVVDCSLNSTITNCYWDVAKFTEGIGYYENTTMSADSKGMTAAEMQNEAFKETLNSNKNTYNNTDPAPAVPACAWGWESGEYPYHVFAN